MNSKLRNKNLQNHANIDLREIAKFEAVASRWWDLNSEFNTLHKINSLHLDYILVRARGLFGKKVLDVGCGGGILTESMAREGAEVTGLDVASELLTVASRHALDNNLEIKYLCQTIEEHAQIQQTGVYNVVTCMEMLEHVPNPLSIVRYCAHLVKPGGDVFFSTLNRNFKSWLIAIVSAEYLLRILPRGTHDFNKFIKPSELLNWVDGTQLQAQNIVGIHYNPLFDKFSFSSNIAVNYILHTSSVSSSCVNY